MTDSMALVRFELAAGGIFYILPNVGVIMGLHTPMLLLSMW